MKNILKFDGWKAINEDNSSVEVVLDRAEYIRNAVHAADAQRLLDEMDSLGLYFSEDADLSPYFEEYTRKASAQSRTDNYVGNYDIIRFAFSDLVIEATEDAWLDFALEHYDLEALEKTGAISASTDLHPAYGGGSSSLPGSQYETDLTFDALTLPFMNKLMHAIQTELESQLK